MKNNDYFPRVLIVYHSCINIEDQHGVSIREWFAEWPKEKLAQIYSGGEVGIEKYCAANFKLGQRDRKFGNLFFRIKDSSLGKSSYTIPVNENIKELNKLNFWAVLKSKVSRWLISTGVGELIFSPVLSKDLVKFVEDFKPEIIYCQGYTLTFTWLPVMIQNKFQIPICFQTGDDWPSYLYRNSPFAFAIKQIIHSAIKTLLINSYVRLANGKLMAEDYQKKYKLAFEVLMMCDNPLRFKNALVKRIVDANTKSIVYTGNLGHGRWNSVIELCEVVKMVKIENFKIAVTAFATTVPPEALNRLKEIENLQILPSPSHLELPSYLKGADILFLPETFDPLLAKDIRLSISTKSHFYMMSEIPVLIYASQETGIPHYAREENWACIVDKQDPQRLADAVFLLLTNDEYCKKNVKRGMEVVFKNHAENSVRKNFLMYLNGALFN